MIAALLHCVAGRTRGLPGRQQAGPLVALAGGLRSAPRSLDVMGEEKRFSETER